MLVNWSPMLLKCHPYDNEMITHVVDLYQVVELVTHILVNWSPMLLIYSHSCC